LILTEIETPQLLGPPSRSLVTTTADLLFCWHSFTLTHFSSIRNFESFCAVTILVHSAVSCCVE